MVIYSLSVVVLTIVLLFNCVSSFTLQSHGISTHSVQSTYKSSIRLLEVNKFARTQSPHPSVKMSVISFISSSPARLLAKTSLRVVSPIIYGGLLSGGLHAVTGPDHLAALIPPSVGQRWWFGMKIGAVWGLGHGISATLLGLGAYLLKGRMSTKIKFLSKMSTVADTVVGLSLIAIGLVGIKEVYDAEKERDDELEAEEDLGAPKTELAIFANGLLHGFSWDGAPSLAPALAMTSLRSALSFFLSYCIGTITVMSLVAAGVGEGTVRLGKAVNSPSLPKKLSFVSSLLAIAIGAYWVFQALT
mmetsp:Transcript_18261/g.18330  ORF Transcript_18261/g.18330 Transcript_18261/m.18330 type:complete len:303 (-) Transcript_18261:105-1013(-)